MQISRPNRRELSAEEQQEFEKFCKMVESACADGMITKPERDRIFASMEADGKVTFEELELVRALIFDKLPTGEIRLDYSP